MSIIYRGFLIACIVCCGVLLRAQPSVTDMLNRQSANDLADSLNTKSTSSASFIIGDIIIEGNRKTKPYIIGRELPFKPGDSVYLPDLVKGFEIARQQLMNTTLFVDVVVALKAFRGYYVDIHIEVKERWYIFPLPYIKPVDRNLAEWFKQGTGLDRLNYGFKFNYNNFTGRNDKLKFWLITGYTKQLQLQYEQPYADKSLKHGYKVGFTYSYNKEINFATIDNEQAFNDTLSGIKRWYGNLDYTYRPGLRTFHAVRLAYTYQEVDSQIVKTNPKYFLNGKNKIGYPEISYSLNYFNVDYIPYPLTGWMGEVNFMKRGFNKEMNMWQVAGKITQNWSFDKKNSFSTQAQGTMRLPFHQPFINQRMFGYGDMYMRGLEDYVVDGVAGILARQTYRRELIRFNVPTYLKSKSHAIIPFRIYWKTYFDMGYCHNPVNPENSLTNRFLYTYGTGIDIVSFYDFVLRIDYSFNQLGQNGLFLHVKSEF